jgi:ATP-dependent RNA helicase DeaD
LTPFEKLGLSAPAVRAIADLGFDQPTVIQKQAIPQLITGNRDFIGLAQTGTGKTAAFGLPLIDQIDPNDPATQALILAPTRELGKQIAGQLALFSKYQQQVNVLAVYGGAPIYQQIRDLRKPQQIIIATPGRLIDLIGRKAVELDQVRFLVLDEADEMLNMGFKDELDEILSYTPATKHTWLFSATMPAAIRRMVKQYMDNPLEVKVDAQLQVNQNIEHQFVTVRWQDKTDALVRFLNLSPDMRGVVFCRTRRDTQELAEELLGRSFKVDALHGDLSQPHRDRVMRRFKGHALQVLIATDVAARGIDVNDLTHVFHHSLPDDNAYYTHRSGRTARAGKDGTSIAFINGREGYKINQLERDLNIRFEKVQIPSTADIQASRAEAWCLSVLEERTKGKLAPELLARAELLFGNLSKEELIAKLLQRELKGHQGDQERDLNAHQEKRREERGGGRGRGHRKGRSFERGHTTRKGSGRPAGHFKKRKKSQKQRS